jgi:hypothetical protein
MQAGEGLIDSALMKIDCAAAMGGGCQQQHSIIGVFLCGRPIEQLVRAFVILLAQHYKCLPNQCPGGQCGRLRHGLKLRLRFRILATLTSQPTNQETERRLILLILGGRDFFLESA